MVESGPRPSDEDHPQEARTRRRRARHHGAGDRRSGPRAWWWMGSGPVGTSLSDSAPNPVVLTSSSAPCAPEKRKPRPRTKRQRKRSRLSLILSRSNGEGFFTLVTSAFSRTPGEESMVAAISSLRNARAAPADGEAGEEIKASGFGRRQRKNEGKTCGVYGARGGRTYLTAGRTRRRRRRAASRPRGRRRRAPRRRPHEPSSPAKPRP